MLGIRKCMTMLPEQLISKQYLLVQVTGPTESISQFTNEN